MSNSRPAGRSLSVRFTETERVLLRDKAGETPLGTFIRSAALGSALKVKTVRRAPLRDSEALGRVLALLGSSRLASNLNQIAKAVNFGSLPVTEETEADLRAACEAIRDMRRCLMLALGIVSQERPKPPSASQAFENAARRP